MEILNTCDVYTSDCFQKRVAEGITRLAAIRRHPAYYFPQPVCHHFSAPYDVSDPEPDENGEIDLRYPEKYAYIRILQEFLDPNRFDILAIGGIWGLEARETTVPDEPWVTESAALMCRAAMLSGATYGGWTWEKPRDSALPDSGLKAGR